jgi:hypothetical protein
MKQPLTTSEIKTQEKRALDQPEIRPRRSITISEMQVSAPGVDGRQTQNMEDT